MEGSDRRWRGAVAGGGERSRVEGSGLRWRELVSGGGERARQLRLPEYCLATVRVTARRCRKAGTACNLNLPIL